MDIRDLLIIWRVKTADTARRCLKKLQRKFYLKQGNIYYFYRSTGKAYYLRNPSGNIKTYYVVAMRWNSHIASARYSLYELQIKFSFQLFLINTVQTVQNKTMIGWFSFTHWGNTSSVITGRNVGHLCV